MIASGKKPNKAYEKISTYLKENLMLVIFLCIGGFLFNALLCLVPILQGQAINGLVDGIPFPDLCRILGLFFGLVLIVQFNRFLKRYLGRLFQSKMTRTMRKVSYRNLLKMELTYIGRASKGDILNKLLADVEDFSNGISKMTMETFDTFVLLAGYLCTLLWLDWKLTGITMFFIILSIVSVKWFKSRIFQTAKVYKEYLSHTKDTTLNCLKNELYYRGMGVSGIYRKRYEEEQKELEKKTIASMALQTSMEPLYHMIGFLGLFFILWFGGKQALAGNMSIGDFSAYLTTYLLVARKASRIGRVYGWYQNMRVAKVRCEPFLKERENSRKPFPKESAGAAPEKEEPLEKGGPQAEGMAFAKAALTARDFSFGFDEAFTTPVLNFSFQPGERIGVCGGVHTGKSTFLAGLSGIYGYEGSLKLDDCEIKEYQCPIGYCPADSLIFEATLEENILLGREGDFQRAVQDAGLKQDISLFQEGKDLPLSHSLVNLSGGQEKRLAVARALFGRSRLILLDDPFQSIDKETTLSILKSTEAYPDSILFLVSNQPFILKQMDRLLFFKENDCLEGSFEELSEHPEFSAFIKGGEA